MASPGSPAAQASGSSGTFLNHSHISQALLASTDDGRTLDFSNKSLNEVRDDAAEELASIGKEEGDDEGCVTRLALVYNHLTTLPPKFALITRLRYLNLRSNAFVTFPEVLTNMPSLEILDISRNKLRKLPPKPGTLRNLRVLSLTRNRLERLPDYLPDFCKLRMLKIEHNPIKWPPAKVIKRTEDGDVGMEQWIEDLREWIRLNPDDGKLPPSQQQPQLNSSISKRNLNAESDFSSHDEWGLDANSKRNQENYSFPATHSRGPSGESIHSLNNPASFQEGSFHLNHASPSNVSLSPFSLSTSAQHDPSMLSLSEREDSFLNGLHGRNASTSFMSSRSAPNATLLSKKSLPDLRSAQFNVQFGKGSRKADSSRKLGELPPNPLPPPTMSNHHPTASASRPSTVRQNSSSGGGAPSMDVERNSYFRRLSTLPSSTVSKTIPDSMLKTTDAIRGILFAVSQMYAAIRHYTVFGIDDRLSGVLGRVLDPASTYMNRLINALDRFDSLSRRGVPPPAVCRALLENCRDNVAIFGKVVGVLQAQLKVLAATDDVRYSRTLLLMLYGAMGEVSNSWSAMVPHLEAIQPLLQDSGPPVSKSRSANVNGQSARSNITTIPEVSTTRNPTRQQLQANASAPPPPATIRPTQRRNAGSFSHKDVQIGRSMVTGLHSPDHESPDELNTPTPGTTTPTPTNGTSNGLRSILRDNPSSSNLSELSSPSMPPSDLSHSRQNSLTSDSSTSAVNGTKGTPPGSTARPTPPALARSRTSDLPGSSQLVDRDLLATMDSAADTALTVWDVIDEVLLENSDTNAGLMDAVDKARTVTSRLKGDIRSVREGYVESDKKALWEDAHLFANIVVQIFSMMKNRSISTHLRANVVRLAQMTKEFTILLHVSSFSPAPSPRPFSPAFSAINGEEARTITLGRSRSATATQQAQPLVMQPDVPWSAMPHQTFNVPPTI
ncbi:RAM signaling network component [Tulasnella sp. 419]|nr:RAM signaling network component [Tulasnella sp. 419]